MKEIEEFEFCLFSDPRNPVIRVIRGNHLGAALLEHVIFLVPHGLERFVGEMRQGIGAHIVGGEG